MKIEIIDLPGWNTKGLLQYLQEMSSKRVCIYILVKNLAGPEIVSEFEARCFNDMLEFTNNNFLWIIFTKEDQLVK